MLNKGGDRRHVHRQVDRPHVRCHLAEVLVEGFRIARELHAGKKVRPNAESESPEPVLLIRCRSYRAVNRAPSRSTATRLVHEVDPEAAPQEDRLIALTAVRCCFPRLRKLADAVPHDHRQTAGVRRNLVEDVRVITVEGLPRGGRRRSRRGLYCGIEGPRARHHCPADGETALLRNRERTRPGCRTCVHHQQSKHERGRHEQPQFHGQRLVKGDAGRLRGHRAFDDVGTQRQPPHRLAGRIENRRGNSRGGQSIRGL